MIPKDFGHSDYNADLRTNLTREPTAAVCPPNEYVLVEHGPPLVILRSTIETNALLFHPPIESTVPTLLFSQRLYYQQPHPSITQQK